MVTELTDKTVNFLESLEPLWRDFEGTLGATTKLWSMSIEMVLILNHYIHAERAGLWEQHLQEVKKYATIHNFLAS